MEHIAIQCPRAHIAADRAHQDIMGTQRARQRS
jgi:hypothetical protein